MQTFIYTLFSDKTLQAVVSFPFFCSIHLTTFYVFSPLTPPPFKKEKNRKQNSKLINTLEQLKIRNQNAV